MKLVGGSQEPHRCINCAQVELVFHSYSYFPKVVITNPKHDAVLSFAVESDVARRTGVGREYSELRSRNKLSGEPATLSYVPNHLNSYADRKYWLKKRHWPRAQCLSLPWQNFHEVRRGQMHKHTLCLSENLKNTSSKCALRLKWFSILSYPKRGSGPIPV